MICCNVEDRDIKRINLERDALAFTRLKLDFSPIRSIASAVHRRLLAGSGKVERLLALRGCRYFEL
jgi:hypothetical protein